MEQDDFYEDFYLEDLEPWFGRVVVAPDESRFLLYVAGTAMAFLAISVAVAYMLASTVKKP